MKKIILVLSLIIILTGCTPKVEYFNKICKTKTNTINITDIETKDITYNSNDEVTEVIITKTYKAKNDEGKKELQEIKEAAENYNNELLTSKAIKISVNEEKENIYSVKYYLDVTKMTENELKTFELKKNWIKYSKKLENENIKCEKITK